LATYTLASPPTAGVFSDLSISSIERPLVSKPRIMNTSPVWPYQKARNSSFREESLERNLRADIIGRADDQCDPEGTNDLAEIADAVAEAHAAGAQPVRPNLRYIRADDRVAGVAKEALGHDQ